MRKWIAAAFVAVLAAVGIVVVAQTGGDDKTTPTSEPITTTVPLGVGETTTVPSVPYDPDTGVIGTIPPIDPNAGEGTLSTGGT